MSKAVTKSSESPGENKKGKGVARKPHSNGKTPKEITNKHLYDKDHVISDEDFRNLDISIDITNDSSHEPLVIPDGSGRPKDADKDPETLTPWDIIK